MNIILVVYHTATGGTETMARTAAAGAAEEANDVHVMLQSAQATNAEHVLQAHGYLFAAAENLAAMAGMMKDFFDRTYYPCLEHLAGRPYGTLICAGNDGQNAARQIERIARGWRLRSISEPCIVQTHAQTPEQIAARKVIGAQDLARCRELGRTLAAGLSLGIY